MTLLQSSIRESLSHTLYHHLHFWIANNKINAFSCTAINDPFEAWVINDNEIAIANVGEYIGNIKQKKYTE